MSRVLQIEFTAYEKEKNKELSRYGRKCPQKEEIIGVFEVFNKIDTSTFFDDMRVRYYGHDWLRLLFPSLFQY